MAQLKKSKKAGLGDEHEHKTLQINPGFSNAEIEVLAEIEDLTKQLV